MPSWQKHLFTLLVIFLTVTIFYARASTAFFCGYDDFYERQRAQFVDRADPVLIISTSHFDSFKYRPLQRLSSLVAYELDPHDALAFRIRNLLFHEASVAAVYSLGWMIFDSWPVAAIGALLFALDPLANQPILAASFGNTSANAFFLSALALFFLALKRTSVGLFCLALFCGTIALYTYESSIVLPGLMAGWWILSYLFLKKLPSRRFLLVFLMLGGALFGSFLVVRHHFNPQGHTPVFGPAVLLKGIVEYSAALLLPVDPVLAHQWFGTPLPSNFHPGFSVLLAGFAAIVMAGAAAFVFRKPIARILAQAGPQRLWFLLFAMFLSILPFLLFTDHVSETYIYLPAAFFCLILARLITLIPSGAARVMILALLLVSYSAGTWVRNGRVEACGATASRIVETLPSAQWMHGDWKIGVARAPDSPALPRYGLYDYSGLDTIAAGEPGVAEYGLRGLESAMQVRTGNPDLKIQIYRTADLPAQCGAFSELNGCFWIHADGSATVLNR